jgi:hypothetical protein
MGNEFSQGLTKNASEGLLRMVLLEFLGGVLQIRGTSGGGFTNSKYVPAFVSHVHDHDAFGVGELGRVWSWGVGLLLVDIRIHSVLDCSTFYLSLDSVFIFLLISRPQ